MKKTSKQNTVDDQQVINKTPQQIDESDFSSKTELDVLKNKNILLLAEMENLKKIHNKEKLELSKYFMANFLYDFILSIEMFEDALNNKNVDEQVKKWLVGFQMIYRNMFESLEKQGLKKIIVSKDDEFNPSIHEAIDQQFSNEVKQGTILEVKRNGYMLNERLIRPASVVISKGTEFKDIEKIKDNVEVLKNNMKEIN